MSLILDALQRSDQERSNQNTVAGLRGLHGESALRRFYPRRLLLVVAVLVVALLAAALALWQAPRESGPAPRGDSAHVAPVADVPAAGPLQKPPAPAATHMPASIGTQPGRAGVPGDSAGAPRLPEAPAAPDSEVAELYQRVAPAGEPSAATVAVEPAPQSTPGANQPASSTVATGALSAAADSMPVEAILGAVQRELASLPPDDDPTPMLRDLSQETRDALPSIFFSNHNWSSQASEKRVTLNGDVLREGDTVLPGVRLVAILPDYIVLEFRDTRFRLRALNSWVNL